MILHALVDYYDRKAADPESGIAPLGWEWKEIPFIAVVGANGKLVRFEDTREKYMKKLRAKSFLVPSLGESKRGTKTNLFWEKIEFVFGLSVDENPDKDRLKKQHRAFVDKCTQALSDVPKSDWSELVRQFLETDNFDYLNSIDGWDDVKKLNQYIVLAVQLNDGVHLIVDFPEIKDSIGIQHGNQDLTGTCLITGEKDKIAFLEPPVKGVYGTKTTGAHLVSVNNKIVGRSNAGDAPAFASFVKQQCANSPISKKAMTKYTTALNSLLGKDSRQKLQIGDATTVFWSDKKSSIEDNYADWIEPEEDNPDSLTESVAELLSSVESGAYRENMEDTKFFVLGLSPNVSRISVRFWHSGTVWEMSNRIAEYFQDLRICHGDKEQEHWSLCRLLASISPLGKKENIPPNLAGNVMRSIMEGLPFPETLLSSAIRRCKVEKGKGFYPCAKIVKGCLNRKIRFNNPHNERKMEMSLDRDNTNIGYLLGRLFATLEKCQKEASPKIDATIKDRYYSSASSSPSMVFASLMNLNNHHLAKIGAKIGVGRKICLEKLVQEIMSNISDFPSHLAMDDQGRFAIGYYHQWQDFFTKKSDSNYD